MKKHLKRLIIPLNIVLIITICLYCVFVIIKKAGNYQIYSTPTVETKIYTLWHIETFEGGSKSRLDYLKAIAREIEAENEGILIMVKSIDPDDLASALESATPDIISFGFGVGDIVLPYLSQLTDSLSVRDELVTSGMFNNKLYALPYIVSGYALITHGELTENFHCGQNGYINPSVIYNELGLTPVEEESQYEAYKDFVNNTSVTLLGSGRDVFRVENLNNIGRTTAIITPVDSYTDLIQYLGLVTNDEITNLFLSLALDDSHQQQLVNYNLYSSKYLTLYYSGIYQQMEKAILNCTVARVFYD